MKIRSLRKDKRFVPEFGGNRDLPESDQVVVEIKTFPTAIEASQYKDFTFDNEGRVSVGYKDSLIVTRHVGKISNLEDDDGKIDTGLTLAGSKNLALYPLITEIRDYLLSTAEELEPGEK